MSFPDIISNILAGDKASSHELIIHLFNGILDDPARTRIELDYLFCIKDQLPGRVYEAHTKAGNVRLYVPDGVSIPLPYTVTLADNLGSLIHPGMHLLDAGSGSGLVGISARKAKVTALDISRLATMATRINAFWNNSPLEVVHADLNGYKPAQKFDIIACNPPSQSMEQADHAWHNDLSNGDLSAKKSEYAVTHNISQHNLLMVEDILRRKDVLCAPGGKLVISNGNMLQDNLGTYMGLISKYRCKCISAEILPYSYSDFSFCTEDDVRTAIFNGVEVYREQALDAIIRPGEQIEGTDYFFRGFVISAEI